MKKKIIISITFVIIILLCLLALYYPKVRIGNVYTESYDTTLEHLKSLDEEYHQTGKVKDYNTVSYQGKLPSTDPKDYMSVYINIETKNYNPLQDYSISAKTDDFLKHKENVLFASSTDNLLPITVNKFTANCETIHYLIYIGDLKEKEIVELVQNTKIKAEIKGTHYGKKTYIIPINNMKVDISYFNE